MLPVLVKIYIVIYAYLKPIAACHTNASNKKNTGIIGRTSTKGSRIEYASGSFANNIAASMFKSTFSTQLSELISILTCFGSAK